jgi:hypothetical protein
MYSVALPHNVRAAYSRVTLQTVLATPHIGYAAENLYRAFYQARRPTHCECEIARVETASGRLR